MSALWTDGEDDARIDVVLRRRVVRAVFQPIVRLETNLPAAYHATVRGPLGSPLETYERLWLAAAHRGVVRDLDELCFAVSLDAAERARVVAPLALFVRRDPDTLAGALVAPASPFGVVVEFDTPAPGRADALHAAAAVAREHGWRVALRGSTLDRHGLETIDDLAPEIVKVDLRAPWVTDDAVARAVAYLGADDRDAPVALVAEGLDSEADVQRAVALGLHHGHGLRYGRPDLLVRAPLLFDRAGVTSAVPDLSDASPAPAPPRR